MTSVGERGETPRSKISFGSLLSHLFSVGERRRIRSSFVTLALVSVFFLLYSNPMSSPPRNHPPNPLTTAATAPNLPRDARARIGATTDPLPPGKIQIEHPKHHHEVISASHDVGETHPKTAEELGVEPNELQKMLKVEGREQQHPHMSFMQQGIDWRGSATQSNKKMPSTHRTPDVAGQLSKGGGK